MGSPETKIITYKSSDSWGRTVIGCDQESQKRIKRRAKTKQD